MTNVVLCFGLFIVSLIMFLAIDWPYGTYWTAIFPLLQFGLSIFAIMDARGTHKL